MVRSGLTGHGEATLEVESSKAQGRYRGSNARHIAVVVASVFSGVVGFVQTAKKPAAPVVSDRGRGFE